nr:DUF6059 family protein [Streptomyces sp. SID4948]
MVREFWETLVLIGRLSCGDPVEHGEPAADTAPPRSARSGPPPGHPERLPHAAPPDARERALWADILDRELDS